MNTTSNNILTDFWEAERLSLHLIELTFMGRNDQSKELPIMEGLLQSLVNTNVAQTELQNLVYSSDANANCCQPAASHRSAA